MQPELINSIAPGVIEITKRDLNALALGVRKLSMVSPEKFAALDWITFFDVQIVEAATKGKTEIVVDTWCPNFGTTKVGKDLKTHYERQAFKFEIYQEDGNPRVKVWVEW